MQPQLAKEDKRREEQLLRSFHARAFHMHCFLTASTMRRALYYLHFTNTNRHREQRQKTFLSEYSQCPFWLQGAQCARQMSMNVQKGATIPQTLRQLYTTGGNGAKIKIRTDNFFPLKPCQDFYIHFNTPLNTRANGCLPVPGMINSCVDSMRIMTAEAETVALLIALMCSNTKFKKVSKK